MATSFFDLRLYEFQCANAQCGEVFKQVIGSLLNADEVVCPKCGTAIDIRESRRTGRIGEEIEIASELDKQASQKK